MSLFKTSELSGPVPADRSQPTATRTSLTPSPRLLKNLKELKNTIGDLQPPEVMPFATGGQWSMHQLMEYLLLITGPAKVWFTTWTITEEPMRAMLDMIQKGMVTELNAVFDYRIEQRKPEAFQLAANITTRIKLTKCHAKVLVIRNEAWHISVMGSANFSKNPRLEAGVIFTDEATAEFNTNWIMEEINRKEGSHAKR